MDFVICACCTPDYKMMIAASNDSRVGSAVLFVKTVKAYPSCGGVSFAGS